MSNRGILSFLLFINSSAIFINRADAFSTAAQQQTVIPPGILGPPEPLRSLEVGQTLKAFRLVVVDDVDDDSDPQKLDFSIERVANSPNIFILRNFLSSSECNQIQALAEGVGMKAAETVTEGDTVSRKNCSVAWIPSSGPDGSSIVSGLVASTVNICLSDGVKSHHSAGVENMQILKYGVGGEFVHHQDGEARVLTVIYYINGVGGTWFPLADRNDGEIRKNKAGVMELVENLEPGNHGIFVKGDSGNSVQEEKSNEHTVLVNKGDAVAFYNYRDDGSAQLDWSALHCGSPTDETKWIANHWYRLNELSKF
eukprot:CAMPEP_0201686952 /NCGR_PEP_ID=MMETSP0578-20130828/1204_1 /ASSEMBLY_ACC=CAM_ASM_000663 /TAXON_ID=267565 /ORGANISM="Skeletonema grethea, Strain CCMP 1804" /LENGTH=311 /DNA_ID=CAMNT_0048171061 /DNA_START=131 /DNA_END=1066 /DNA_ORIENTATION=+